MAARTTSRYEFTQPVFLPKGDVVGRHIEGRTYVVPVAYVSSDGAFVGHSATGLKLDMLRKNPKVCVEVDHVADLADWRSIVAWGRFEELEGEEAENALNRLMARFVPFTVSETSAPARRLAPTNSQPDPRAGVFKARGTHRPAARRYARAPLELGLMTAPIRCER